MGQQQKRIVHVGELNVLPERGGPQEVHVEEQLVEDRNGILRARHSLFEQQSMHALDDPEIIHADVTQLFAAVAQIQLSFASIRDQFVPQRSQHLFSFLEQRTDELALRLSLPQQIDFIGDGANLLLQLLLPLLGQRGQEHLAIFNRTSTFQAEHGELLLQLYNLLMGNIACGASLMMIHAGR